MDAIGDLGNPQKDAAALEPLLDKELEEAIDGIVGRVVPAIKTALVEALDGLTITILRTNRSLAANLSKSLRYGRVY